MLRIPGWWNVEVQKAIKEKIDCFKCLYLDRSATNMEKFKQAQKDAKRAVSEARGRAYEDLYQRLSMKEGERDIYNTISYCTYKVIQFELNLI